MINVKGREAVNTLRNGRKSIYDYRTLKSSSYDKFRTLGDFNPPKEYLSKVRRLVFFDIETIHPESIQGKKADNALRIKKEMVVGVACYRIVEFECDIDLYAGADWSSLKDLNPKDIVIDTWHKEQKFLSLLYDERCFIVVHNASFELTVLRNILQWDDAILQGRVIDTMDMARKLNHSSASLKYLSSVYTDLPKGNTDDYSLIYRNESIFNRDKISSVLDGLPTYTEESFKLKYQEFVDYCALDCEITYLVFFAMMKELSSLSHILDTFDTTIKYLQLIMYRNFRGIAIEIGEVKNINKSTSELKSQTVRNIPIEFLRKYCGAFIEGDLKTEVKSTCHSHFYFNCTRPKDIKSVLPDHVKKSLELIGYRNSLVKHIKETKLADFRRATEGEYLITPISVREYEGFTEELGIIVTQYMYLIKLKIRMSEDDFSKITRKQLTDRLNSMTIGELATVKESGSRSILCYQHNPFFEMKPSDSWSDVVSLDQKSVWQKRLVEGVKYIDSDVCSDLERAVNLVNIFSADSDEAKLRLLESLMPHFELDTAKGGNSQILHYPFHSNAFSAITGRATSSGLNVLNLSNEAYFRKLIISRKPLGKISSVDFSAIEIRMGSWLVIQAFRDLVSKFPEYIPECVPSDPYSTNTAQYLKDSSRVGHDEYGLFAQAIDPSYNSTCKGKKDPRRSVAKVATLGLSYGMGNATLAESCGLTPNEAAKYSKAFFHRFDLIKPVRSILYKLLLDLPNSKVIQSFFLVKPRSKPRIVKLLSGSMTIFPRISINLYFGSRITYRNLGVYTPGAVTKTNKPQIFYNIDIDTLMSYPIHKRIHYRLPFIGHRHCSLYMAKTLQNMTQAVSFNILQYCAVSCVDPEHTLDFITTIHDEILIEHDDDNDPKRLEMLMKSIEDVLPPRPKVTILTETETKTHY